MHWLLQVEGAFVFGLGMMTTEEVVIDPKTGRLLTDSTWTYKIPTAPCVPAEFNVSFLKVCHAAPHPSETGFVLSGHFDFDSDSWMSN